MPKKNKLAAEIGRFVQDHPHGWGHGDWLGFLHHLGQSGQAVPDADSLGLALERERLKHTLQGCGVAGLGPKRTEALCDAFPSLHHLRSAGPDEIAGRAGIPQSLAESVARALQ
jgi:hypothetical protein